ncbi:MAG TPA: histidine phosphatase family protein [Ramlibacter sp.]
MRRACFLTHPNVVVDPALPVPQWPLSDLGRSRVRAGLDQPWVRELTAIYTSAERKALDTAAILAAHVGLTCSVVEDLGENDRSATGFLPPPEFERMADAFFANPDESVRGWESARHAQQRVVAAVAQIVAGDRTSGSLAIVSHGAVGTLLYCHLSGVAIDRVHDQPSNGGGNYYSFVLPAGRPEHRWRPIDAPAA